MAQSVADCHLHGTNPLNTSLHCRLRFSHSALNLKHTYHLWSCGSKEKNIYFLTPWEPIYEYIIPGFRPKTSSFRLPYQHHSSSADCARELFKPSKDSASLLVCTRKNFLVGDCRFFCEWRHMWSSVWAILAHVTWPRAQPLGQSISLKFSLETRLESESFEPLINFLAFLVQKLWSKIIKLII